MTLQKLIYLVLALVLTAAPAHAKVQFYSSFATTGPAPTECTEASAIVTPLIAQFHAPADWTRNNIPDSATPRAGRGPNCPEKWTDQVGVWHCSWCQS
jgi:hypothetical protein